MIIYKIVNKVNNKMYIGQTIKTLNERYNEHMKHAFLKSSTQYNGKFYRAIRKYGPENFEPFIVEDNIDDRKVLNEKEIFYIKEYDTYKHGYNTVKGGEAIIHDKNTKRKISKAESGCKNHMYGMNGSKNPMAKPLKCLNDGKIFLSVVEACEYYHKSSSAIRKTIYDENAYTIDPKTNEKLKFVYLDKEKYNPYISHAIPKKCEKSDVVKNLFDGKIFESIAECSRYYKIPYQNMHNKFKQHNRFYYNKEKNLCIVEEKYFSKTFEDLIKENVFNFRVYNKTKDKYYYSLPDSIKDILEYKREDYEKYRGTFRRNKKIILNGNEIIDMKLTVEAR